MWPKRKPDPIERLIEVLLEQNALLRADLLSRGVSVPVNVQTNQKPSPSIRRRTEADVMVMTRDRMYELQERAKDTASRPWNQAGTSINTSEDSSEQRAKLG